MKDLISIIIRTKNEEQWIENCLIKIFQQKKVKFEVIIVDNNSKDKTVFKAKKFPVKLIKIKKFLPGKAINLGIEKSNGKIISCLSAHCIPVNDLWLYNLVKDLKKKNVAGIYGRQLPLPYSSNLDKRDLLNTFGLDKKIQKKDSFFHNANSAFLKSFWLKEKFDEILTNIEDRVWAHKWIKKGFKIIYEPSAAVYHWHGIHQDLDEKRCANVVRILENLDTEYNPNNYKSIEDLKVNVIIPQRGKMHRYKKKEYLIESTIKNAIENKYVNSIYVVSENKIVNKIAKRYKCLSPFKRPKNSMDQHIDLLSVAKDCLLRLEKKNVYSDYIIVATEIFIDREKYFFDKLIKKIFLENNDLIFPVRQENGSVWKKSDLSDEIKLINDGFKPKKLRNESIITSRPGYGFIIRSDVLRSGNYNPKNIGFLKISGNNFNIYEK